MEKRNMKNVLRYTMLVASILLSIDVTYAWINGVGSPSTDPNNPVIGTHDRMLNDAINMLPANYQSKINVTAADYGTEMPDYNVTQCACIYGLRDQRYHQVYYWKNGTLQDDSSARRAQEEYNLAMANLSIGDKYNLSIHVGMMSHYMADISNFAHTMGNNTDWVSEGLIVHGEYENLVANNSNKFLGNTSVKFDGIYDNITAYNATLDSANDTTFDNKFGNGTYTNMWMYEVVNSSSNLTYASADPRLLAMTKQSLNYSVNLMADVIYTMLSNNTTTPVPTPNATVNATPTPAPVSNSGSSGGSSSSSSSGGSSGGGGGGSTAEPYDNIFKYEVQEHAVFTTPVSFRYNTLELSIYEEMVTSSQSDTAALRIEVLKDTSKLVGKPAPGIVYKNINTWVNYKRIKNATIRFKVENSWLDSNALSSDKIKILRWDNDSQDWVALPIIKINDDDVYTRFESQSDILSASLAIVGGKETEEVISAKGLVASPETSTNPKTSSSTETGEIEQTKEKAPGFETMLSIISILLIVYLYRRTR